MNQRNFNLNDYHQVCDTKDSQMLVAAIEKDIDVFLIDTKDFLVMDIDMPEILSMKEFLERY